MSTNFAFLRLQAEVRQRSVAERPATGVRLKHKDISCFGDYGESTNAQSRVALCACRIKFVANLDV